MVHEKRENHRKTNEGSEFTLQWKKKNNINDYFLRFFFSQLKCDNTYKAVLQVLFLYFITVPTEHPENYIH